MKLRVKIKEVRRSRKVGYHKIYMLFTVSINGHDRFLVPDVSITTAREDIALPLTYCAVKGTLAMKTSLGLIGTPAKRGRPSASDVPMTLLHMIVRGSSSMIYVRTTSQIRRQSWKPSGYDETALDALVLGFYYLKRDPEPACEICEIDNDHFIQKNWCSINGELGNLAQGTHCAPLMRKKVRLQSRVMPLIRDLGSMRAYNISMVTREDPVGGDCLDR